MRFREGLLLFLVGSLYAGVGASAATPTVPACGQGDVSSADKPCITVKDYTGPDTGAMAGLAGPVPISPNIGELHVLGGGETILRFLDIPKGLYQLDVTKTSGGGSATTFTWIPPDGMMITKVISPSGATCVLLGGSIMCHGSDKGTTSANCGCPRLTTLEIDFSATGLPPTFGGQYYTWSSGGAPLSQHA